MRRRGRPAGRGRPATTAEWPAAPAGAGRGRQHAIDGEVGGCHRQAVERRAGVGIGSSACGAGGRDRGRALNSGLQDAADARDGKSRAEQHGERPYAEAIAAVAEMRFGDFIARGPGPRRTQAAGKIAAGAEARDCDQGHIGSGEDGETLGRDAGIGIGRDDAETQRGAEGQQDHGDGRGAQRAEYHGTPFEITWANSDGGGDRSGRCGMAAMARCLQRRPIKDKINITTTTRPTR